MELSPQAITLLCDEAYLFLCREVVEEKLAAIAEEKARLQSSRPPFGVFVRKSTRDAFTRSMRTALETESALRDRLTRIARLEEIILPRVEHAITTYLSRTSPHFCLFQKIRTHLEAWEVGLLDLPDLLKALSRELRVLRHALCDARPLEPHETAALRETTTRVENYYIGLAHRAIAISEHCEFLDATGIAVPTLPNLQRVAWAQELCALPLDTALGQISGFEFEIRQVIEGGVRLAIAQIQASHENARQQQAAFVERYWNQVRTHARIHYVEERDLDEVLETLTHTYGGAHDRSDEAHAGPLLVPR